MDAFLELFQQNKLFFDAAHGLSAIVSLLGWTVGAVIVTIAWRRNAIKTVTLGPFGFEIQEAVQATAAAARDWQTKSPNQQVNLERIRSTIERAFVPSVGDQMIGKSVLWVDDNPSNNKLAVRALKKLRLDVEQAESTESGLQAMQGRHFDLVISDMGRGTNSRAGYELLEAIRASGSDVPFLIFAGSDTAEFRREAAERGAQLSTNDMLELIDNVIGHLSH